MNIYVIVKYTDVPIFNCYGETDYCTKTDILQVFSVEKDANIECRILNQSNTEDNILYDVIETVLY